MFNDRPDPKLKRDELMTEKDPRMAMARKLESDVFTRSSNKEDYLQLLREHVLKLKTYARSQAGGGEGPAAAGPAAATVAGAGSGGATGGAAGRPGGTRAPDGASHRNSAAEAPVAHESHKPPHCSTPAAAAAQMLYRHYSGGHLERGFSGDFARAIDPAPGAMAARQAYPDSHHFAEGMHQGMQDGQGFNAQYMESAFIGSTAPQTYAPASQGAPERVADPGQPSGVVGAVAGSLFGDALPPLGMNPETELGGQEGDQELFDFLLGNDTADHLSLQGDAPGVTPQAAVHYQQHQAAGHPHLQAHTHMHQHPQHQHQHQHHRQHQQQHRHQNQNQHQHQHQHQQQQQQQHHHQHQHTALAGAHQVAHAHHYHQAQAYYRYQSTHGDHAARGIRLWEGHDASAGRASQQAGPYGIPSPSGYPSGFHAHPVGGHFGGDAVASAHTMQRQRSEAGQSPHAAHAMQQRGHLGSTDPFAFMGQVEMLAPPSSDPGRKLPSKVQKEFDLAQHDAQQRLIPKVVKALKLVKHLMKVAQAPPGSLDEASLWLQKQAVAGMETMQQHWRQHINDFTLLVSPRKKVQEGTPVTREYARDFCAGVLEIASRITETNRFIQQVEALFRAFAHRKATMSREQALPAGGAHEALQGHGHPPGSGGFLVGEEIPGAAAPGGAVAAVKATQGGGKKRQGAKATQGEMGGGKKAKKAASAAKPTKASAAKKTSPAAAAKKAAQPGKKVTAGAAKKAPAKKAPAKKPPTNKAPRKKTAGGPKTSPAKGGAADAQAPLGPGEQLLRSISHASPGAKARVGSALRDMLHKPISGPAKLAQLFFLPRTEGQAPAGSLQRQGSLTGQSKVASPCTPVSEASADTTEAALPKTKAPVRSAEDLLQEVQKALSELPGLEELDVAIVGQKSIDSIRTSAPGVAAEAALEGKEATAGAGSDRPPGGVPAPAPPAAPTPAVAPASQVFQGMFQGVLAEVRWKDDSCAPLLVHFSVDFPRIPPSAVFRHSSGEAAARHDGILAAFASRLRLLPPSPGLAVLLKEWRKLATGKAELAWENPAAGGPTVAAPAS